MAVVLITGGARSGKSRHAEARARAFSGRPVHIATAEALDAEMEERIAQHRARRGNDWIEREAPLDLVQALTETDGGGARLVDCLTLWLSNLMHAQQDAEARTGILCRTLADLPGLVALVSNEVGLGLVPETPLGRAFRDAQGRLNQRIAARSDRVLLMVAGLPMVVK